MAFTIANIASSQALSDIALSPDGRKVIYCVAPTQKAGDHKVSSIWYSPDTTKAGNAKQLTSGLFNDTKPVWNVNSNAIYFLSDRHKQGGPKQIYIYYLDGPGEPSLVIEPYKANKRGIEEFRVSPDGHYIAFSSRDEPSAEEEKKIADKDDARVWGDRKGHARLRLYTISTGEVRTLVEDKKHVVWLTWSPDSKALLYLLTEGPDAEAVYCGITSFFVISILPSPSDTRGKHIVDLVRPPRSDTIWPSTSHPAFYTRQSYDPKAFVDALAVHRHFNDSSCPDSDPFYLGQTEDASQLINLQSSDGEFAVAVESGMSTRVDIMNHDGKLFTLFESGKLLSAKSFDIKKVDGGYVMAAIRSSGPNKEAPDVWVGRISRPQSVSLTLTTQLSSHYPWFANHKLGPVETFEWTGEDGVSLEGMAWFPQGVDPSHLKTPLPTILQVHGGPYDRNTSELKISSFFWPPILAEQGYLVLTPNYRGSSGRGHKFARAVRHSMGTVDWSDVNDMVNEAVKRGLADKDKLAIGGWSQGGFLTAWGVSQTKNKFRCAIMGAGVSDWGALACESNLPDFEAELGGAAPWLGATARLAGDPIRHVKDVETAVLILHGERDPRVNPGQGVGFHRGLRRMSRYPERHTLVLYPREEHSFVEKKHAEDVMKRVVGHYETWLK
ncbi:alpha/beta-hydrolase [Ramaria rubella]|nr:alpha/beta-hydrolase [Ramaria rubella]